jgi:hypothetical protein
MFNASDTGNYVNDMNSALCKNVATRRTLKKIDLEFVRELASFVPNSSPVKGTGGDMIEGLWVATEMIKKHCGTKKYKKRIFLMTDGERPSKDDRTVVEEIKKTDIRFNVIAIDFAQELADEDEDESESKETNSQTKNKQLLTKMTQAVNGAMFPATLAMEIYKQFKKREVMARSKFKGNLDVARDLKLGVQIFARTREEPFPTLKKYSKVALEGNEASGSSLTSGVVRIDR